MNQPSAPEAFLILSFFVLGTLNAFAEPAAIWAGGNGRVSDANGWVSGVVPDERTAFVVQSGILRLGEVGEAPSRAADTVVSGGILEINGTFRNAHGGSSSILLNDGKIEHRGNFFVIGHDTPGGFEVRGGQLNSHVGKGFFLSDLGRSSSTYAQSGGEVTIQFAMQGPVLTRRWFAMLGKAANDHARIEGGTLRVDFGNPPFESDPGSEADGSISLRALHIQRNSELEILGGSVELLGPRYVAVGIDWPGLSQLSLRGGSLLIEKASSFPASLLVGTGSEGIVTIEDGRLEVSVVKTGAEPGIGLLIGLDGGYGKVLQSGGTVALYNGDLVLSGDAGSVGVYEMNGGKLRANDIRIGHDGRTGGRFIFSGGEIELAGDRRQIVTEGFFQFKGRPSVVYDPVENVTRITHGGR
ncbi:MAG: hypothetical protein ACFCU4_00090 [Puniceicoccaceae bacterium]